MNTDTSRPGENAIPEGHQSAVPYDPVYAWWVLAVLSFATIVAFIDRQVINLMVDPIKADLGLSDTQISLLQGFAFAAFYAVMAVPLGRLADVRNRKKIIMVGMVFWSIATATCGFARSFWTLFSARMMIGIGEATLTPAGYSMLSDYFPRDKLGRAISVFLGSGFVGSGIALVVGGYVISLVGADTGVLLPIIGEVRPWQAVFLMVATPGIICVALMLTVREPKRIDTVPLAAGSDGSIPLGDVVRFLGKNWRVIGAIYIGFSLLAAVQFGLGAWVPTFFVRVHGWTASDIGYIYGVYFVVFGSAGVLAGGWLSDWLYQRGYRDSNLRTAVIAGLPMIPLVATFPLVENATVALVLLAPAAFFGSMPFGAGTAALPMIVPNRMRAQIVALYLLFANLLGQGIGPTVIASITDFVFGDPKAVGYSIAIGGCLIVCLAVTVLILGLKPFRERVEDVLAGRM